MTGCHTDPQRTPASEERRTPSYLELGASLYLPATRLDLIGVLNQQTLPSLRSVIVCTEDAVHEHDLPAALENLGRTLPRLAPVSLRRFLRPRNPEVLAQILRLDGVEHIDGVVLPKVDEHALLRYAQVLAEAPRLLVMPTLETDIVFARGRLERLGQHLLELDNQILCLRIGGNDILHLLGLKRPKQVTLYETPLRAVINDLIISLRPLGFELSSPVFEHIDSPHVLQAEVLLDLVHGLWSKTAIHPTQLTTIEDQYRVSPNERALAQEILAADAPAVFLSHGQMVEPGTHSHWAKRILERAAVYGWA